MRCAILLAVWSHFPRSLCPTPGANWTWFRCRSWIRAKAFRPKTSRIFLSVSTAWTNLARAAAAVLDLGWLLQKPGSKVWAEALARTVPPARAAVSGLHFPHCRVIGLFAVKLRSSTRNSTLVLRSCLHGSEFGYNKDNVGHASPS